jgi:2-polyprenyl-6-methoxyphenol hydroxylase-like FAD-dependent oxidoreductase
VIAGAVVDPRAQAMNGTEQARATEIAIVGGGPVGLALALFLDLYGVRCTLFNTEPTTRWHPKGNTHNQRTMEHYRKLGIAAAVRRLGLPDQHPLDVAYFTRFSGFEIARARIASRAERLARQATDPPTDQFPEPMHRVNQMYVERFMLEHAARRPLITLRFGWEVEDFAQDPAGVTLRARDAAGTVEHWRAAYLVGCDGSRSLVRRMLGIAYEREEHLMNVFMGGAFNSIHMRIPAFGQVLVGDRAWMYLTINPDARAVLISLNGADEFMMHRPAAPGETVDEEALVAFVQRAIGVPIAVEIIGHRPWHAGGYLVAERFQDGRVLLAGDAVHLFTPTGGFGMNTGIDDVANLSWKLAAVLRGWGGPGLIASYEAERRPIAHRNTRVARELGKAWHDVAVSAVIEEDSPQGQRARAEAARSSFVVDNHFVLPEERDFVGVVLGARYDGLPLIVADGVPPPDEYQTYQPSSVPGGRAPHLWVDGQDGVRRSLFDLFGTGFTLLCHGSEGADGGALVAAAERWGLPLAVVTLAGEAARALYPRRLTLVRPDQHVAWRGDAVADAEALLRQVSGHPVFAPAH